MAFSDIFYEKEMKYVRFDNIAGAIQKLLEERTEEWVRKLMKLNYVKVFYYNF